MKTNFPRNGSGKMVKPAARSGAFSWHSVGNLFPLTLVKRANEHLGSIIYKKLFFNIL